MLLNANFKTTKSSKVHYHQLTHNITILYFHKVPLIQGSLRALQALIN